MTTYREKIPGAAVITDTDLPTLSQLGLSEGGEVLRIDADHGTYSSEIITDLTDVITGTVYPYAPSITGFNPTATFQVVDVNGMNVIDGNRSGNPSNIRPGHQLPAATVSEKEAITIAWNGRIPASTWTDHPGAGTQTICSFLNGNDFGGNDYLWRVRASAIGYEARAARSWADVTAQNWISVSVECDTDEWLAGEVSINFQTGRLSMTIYRLDETSKRLVVVDTSSVTGMSGSPADSPAAGDGYISFGYQFYSTGSAQQLFGQVADFMVWPAELTQWQRFGFFEHSRRRIIRAIG